MEVILAICTILGGASAVWFFWDKIVLFINGFNFSKTDKSISVLPLSDDEFTLVERLLNLPNPKEYLYTSEDEEKLFNSLANQGYFKKSKSGAYIPTRIFKRLRKNIP